MQDRKTRHRGVEKTRRLRVALHPIHPVAAVELLGRAFTGPHALQEKRVYLHSVVAAKKDRRRMHRSFRVALEEFTHRCQRKSTGWILEKYAEAGQRAEHSVESLRVDTRCLSERFDALRSIGQQIGNTQRRDNVDRSRDEPNPYQLE